MVPSSLNVRPSSREGLSSEASKASYAHYRALIADAERRHREAHDPARPGYLTRLAQDLLDPSRRILAALEFAERQDDGQLHDGLWAFQPFAMSVGQLLISALAGCNPLALATWQSGAAQQATARDADQGPFARTGRRPTRAVAIGLTRVPRAQIERALAHVTQYGQAREALWPYQAFSLNVGELLQAALRAG